MGVESGPADPRGRAARHRAGVDRRRGRCSRRSPTCSESAPPSCTSTWPAARRRSSRSASRCCSSDRSSRACAQSLRETQRAVRRNRAGIPADAEAMAVALLEDGDRLLAAFDALRTHKLDAARIRVHGDLHLGQALWTGSRCRVHRLRRRARSLDRGALDQALAAGRRRRDAAVVRLRRARRPGDVGRARPHRRDRRPSSSSAGVGRRRRTAGPLLVDLPHDAARGHDCRRLRAPG